MKFRVILHDLDFDRGQRLSSGESEVIGIVEAESEHEVSELLGLELVSFPSDDDESPALAYPVYRHPQFSEVEFEIDIPLSTVLASEQDLIAKTQETMKSRNEAYGVGN